MTMDMENEEVALVPVKKKTSAELMKDLAKEEGNVALVAVFDRMNQLETVNGSIKEVIMAARDLERHYAVPGPKRFQRLVRLRAALDVLEDRIRKGRL